MDIHTISHMANILKGNSQRPLLVICPELYVLKYINGNIYAEETSHANVIVFYIQFYKEI
jgi:hypothetical protein